VDVTVNGQLTQLPPGLSVAELVRRQLPDPRSVAVAVNGAVVRTGDWERTRVSPGDAVEIVTAQQGG
jgi:sulfur carrier protein